MVSQLSLIKLGGSVITNKQIPLSANLTAISRIAKCLSLIKKPMILVHGGGSYGHYWSVRYNMHSASKAYNPRGIGIVHASMITLNQIIVEIMSKHDMNPYGLPPTALVLNNSPIHQKVLELAAMSKRKITPISFGDVVYRSNLKFSILSGDELITILASVLRPTKIIFAINVDGIYNNLHDKRLLPSFDENKSARFLKVKADVTGGMMRKVHEALKISKMGLDVWLVNGFKPSRIAKILRDEKAEGTVIRGKKGTT